MKVNLDSQTRSHTEEAVLNGKADSTTFEMAQKRIQYLMEKDSYQRFLRSQIYQSLLELTK